MATFTPPKFTHDTVIVPVNDVGNDVQTGHRMRNHWALVGKVHGFLPPSMGCDLSTVRKFLSYVKNTDQDFFSILETGSNQKIGNAHNKKRLINLYVTYSSLGNPSPAPRKTPKIQRGS